MPQVKFGKAMLHQPTPSRHSNVIDLTSAISGVLVTWLTTATYIPNHISNIISSILGLIILLVQASKPFIGVVGLPHDVPTEDVVEIKEPETKN